MERELEGLPQPKNRHRPIDSPYKTVDEAAEYLRLNPRTLNNMRSAGRGPCFHKHGRRVLYHIDELAKWSGLTKKTMKEPEVETHNLFA